MRVALVHELLTMRGGAERVLRIVADLYPDAPIYTLLYDERKLGDWFSRERIQTSFLQKAAFRFPLSIFPSKHHLYLPFFPQAVEAWDFSDYDLVFSLSSAFVHGIITGPATKHVCYVNSPARYLWDRTHDVLEHGNPLRRLYGSCLFHRLRLWDSEAAERPDRLLTSSREVQRRIELYWRRESEVVYPPIDDVWLRSGQCAVPRQAQERLGSGQYYLVVSTLVPYKRIELAIEACDSLDIPLKIVGEGPHRKRLESIAGPKTEFLGYQPRRQLASLYENAIATIFPGKEDFGLVPLESMACGTPVIAYRGGGVLETVQDGVSGVFFDEQSSTSLAQAIVAFDPTAFSRGTCQMRARPFSRAGFEQQVREVISDVCESPVK